MKKLLSLLVAICLTASVARADSTSDFIGLGLSPELASAVAKVFNYTASGVVQLTTMTADAADSSTTNISGGGAVLTNGTRGATLFLRGNEFASTGGSISALAGDVTTANINLSIENASSNVIIKDTTTGNLWSFTDAGALVADATNGGSLVISKAANGLVVGETGRSGNVTTATTLAVPLYVSAAASGTDLAAFIGSGASASGPVVDFFKTRATSGAATTIVSANDAVGTLRFLGANGTTYDPAITIVGSISGTPGAATDMGGKLAFNLSPDGSATPAAVLTLDQDKSAAFTGTVTSSRTSDLGWAVVDGADNTACNSICTSAAVFGFNLSAGATAPNIVGPSDATADICLCAGAS